MSPTLATPRGRHNSLFAEARRRCRYPGQVAIFGRNRARQRLRRATQESLTIPAFSSPIDCTPWVVGGLWPAELSAITAETAKLAEHLGADLQLIARKANEQLRALRRNAMTDSARHAQEALVIDEARVRAVRRVQSTVRHLNAARAEVPAPHKRPPTAPKVAGTDIDKTQVLPAVRDVKPVRPAEPRVHRPQTSARGRHHAQLVNNGAPKPPVTPAPHVPPDTGAAGERLRRLLAFVAQQEPQLNWAVGARADGTTVLVTDLAHGWIPPSIRLPAGVRLLAPERRTGNVSQMLGITTRIATYAPGDALNWSAEFAATESSVQPRELPAVEDLGWELGRATHWRDGIPREVHTLAKAASAGTDAAEHDVGVLRVHRDAAHQQLLAQYPKADPAHLLNCLLLSATDGMIAGDSVSANYHMSWFQKLDGLSAGQ